MNAVSSMNQADDMLQLLRESDERRLLGFGRFPEVVKPWGWDEDWIAASKHSYHVRRIHKPSKLAAAERWLEIRDWMSSSERKGRDHADKHAPIDGLFTPDALAQLILEEDTARREAQASSAVVAINLEGLEARIFEIYKSAIEVDTLIPTVREIAAVLGISKSSVQRAVDRLRAQINRPEEIPEELDLQIVKSAGHFHDADNGTSECSPIDNDIEAYQRGGVPPARYGSKGRIARLEKEYAPRIDADRATWMTKYGPFEGLSLDRVHDEEAMLPRKRWLLLEAV